MALARRFIIAYIYARKCKAMLEASEEDKDANGPAYTQMMMNAERAS